MRISSYRIVDFNRILVISLLHPRPNNDFHSLIPILAQIHPQLLQRSIPMAYLVLCRAIHLRICISFTLDRREYRIPTEMTRSSCRYDISLRASLE